MVVGGRKQMRAEAEDLILVRQDASASKEPELYPDRPCPHPCAPYAHSDGGPPRLTRTTIAAAVFPPYLPLQFGYRPWSSGSSNWYGTRTRVGSHTVALQELALARNMAPSDPKHDPQSLKQLQHQYRHLSPLSFVIPARASTLVRNDRQSRFCATIIVIASKKKGSHSRWHPQSRDTSLTIDYPQILGIFVN